MEIREKLVELMNHVSEGHVVNLMQPGGVEELADYLISHGVTIKRPPIKFLPCTCGANSRSEAFNFVLGSFFYRCNRCGKSSLMGKTKREAKLNWNRMINPTYCAGTSCENPKLREE